MKTCAFCGKELIDEMECDCFGSLLDQGEGAEPAHNDALPLSTSPDSPAKSPAAPSPKPSSKPSSKNWSSSASRKSIFLEIREVLSETMLPYRECGEKQKPIVLSLTSSLVLLGLHLLLLFFFFSSMHRSFQKLLGTDIPASGLVVILPLVCIAIHILAHWGFISLFTDSNEMQISIDEIASIISANTASWSVALLVIGLILRLFSFTSSIGAFFILLLVGFAYVTTCFLFVRRLEPYQGGRGRRTFTVAVTTSVQTGLLFVAMFSQIIRMIDQFLGTLFK